MTRRNRWLSTGALLATGTLVHAGDRPAGGGSVSGTFDAPHRPVWVGEAFDLTLTWRADWSAFRNLEGPLQWSAEPLVADTWDKPRLSDVRSPSGEELAAASFHTRALALRPGIVSLNPARQTVIVETGTEHTGDYERSVTRNVVAQSTAVTVQVRALPTPPAGFSGAIGHFTLAASADPIQPRVGQAVVWTLILSGVGNWPYLQGLPVRRVSRDFDVVGTSRASDAQGATLFERSTRETVVLIPRREGRYVLGPVDMLVFEPDRGQYLRISAPSVTVEVAPSSGAVGGTGASQSRDMQGGQSAPTAPALLDGTGEAIAPMAQSWWQVARLIPPVLVAGAWILLAVLRALQRDPTRQARRAYARMQSTLPAIACTTDVVHRRTLVRLWQKDAAVLWKFRGAAPVPASFDGHRAWQLLWADSDIFLYGRSAALPADWVARADRILPERRPPHPLLRRLRRSTSSLLLSCMLGGVLMMCSTPVAAALPGEYSRHDILTVHPLDWKARYNAAVASAARERWDEAAGLAGIAWIQHPNARCTRELWIRTAREAGYAAAVDGGAPLPLGLLNSIASATSPSAWRWIWVAMEYAGAAAAVLVLLARYGRAPKRSGWIGVALLGGAASGVLTASLALHVYGVLVEADAVLIWRTTVLRAVPVESPPDVPPRPIALTAGTVGRVDRHFLDWRRVTLGDGRAGWLRQSDLMSIWTANN